MRKLAPWLWVNCERSSCLHRAPMVLAPLTIRWGGDASSDVRPVLQMRPQGRFADGTELARTLDTGWAPFPADG